MQCLHAYVATFISIGLVPAATSATSPSFDFESAVNEETEVLLLQTYVQWSSNLSSSAALKAAQNPEAVPKAPKLTPRGASWPSANVLIIEILLALLYMLRVYIGRMQYGCTSQDGPDKNLGSNSTDLLPASPQDDSLEPRLLHYRASRIASSHPSRIALIDGDVQESFGQLHASALYVAMYLVEERGVKPCSRTPIGVCAAGLRMMHAIYGIVYTGNPYIALPVTLPAAARQFMVADANIQVVLADSSALSLEGALEGASPIHVLESSLTKAWAPSWKVWEHDLAYVLYTSGSTGKPKGVLAAHSAYHNRLAWMWKRYPLAEGEVGIQKTALGWIDHVQEIFGFLGGGAPLVLAPTKVSANPLQLISLCRENGVSRLALVPSLLRVIVESYGKKLANELPCLRFWIVSGEPFQTDLLREALQAAAPGSTFLNTYGTTEVAGDVAWSGYSASSALPESAVVPVGRAIPPNIIHLLDPDTLHHVSQGEPGEIFVEGPHLAVGYHNRPEEDEIRFVKLPHLGIERALRTGDFGRFGNSNMIEFLGRTDQQVKVHGQRVEILQVEFELGKALSSGITEGKERDASVKPACAVMAIPSERYPGSYVLLAFIETASAGGVPEPKQRMLRQEMLKALLPAHVPSAFFGIEGLPRLVNGKLDRVALKQMAVERAGSEQEQDYVLEEIDSLGQVRQILGEHVNSRRVIGNMNTCALAIAALSHWMKYDAEGLVQVNFWLERGILGPAETFFDVALLIAGAGALHGMGGEARFNFSWWEPNMFVLYLVINYLLVGQIPWRQMDERYYYWHVVPKNYLYVLPLIFFGRVWVLSWHKIITFFGLLDSCAADIMSIAVALCLQFMPDTWLLWTNVSCYLFGFFFAAKLLRRVGRFPSACEFGLSACLLAVTASLWGWLLMTRHDTWSQIACGCLKILSVACGIVLFACLPQGVDMSLPGIAQLSAYVMFVVVEPWVFNGISILGVRLFPSLIDMLLLAGKAPAPGNAMLEASVLFAYVAAYLVLITEVCYFPNYLLHNWRIKLHGHPPPQAATEHVLLGG
mmetsp:Transcript_76361/g.139086  ORF Transcript_76361/g.139086 Transcript_76361/m.139086 type:complete len:1048 (-) Transcript_76361:118-3261(-)